MDEFSTETQGLLEQVISSVRLPIDGMTCQSCVRNIEGNIRTKPGIISIKVNLTEKAGYIDYDANITDPYQIANDIDDMGFECTYELRDDEQIAANILNGAASKSSILSTRINVNGMTCQSCVRNIEGTVGGRTGIHKIRVSLEQKMAFVDYDSNIVTANDVAEMIDDMGFEAKLAIDGQTSSTLKTDNYIVPKGEYYSIVTIPNMVQNFASTLITNIYFCRQNTTKISIRNISVSWLKRCGQRSHWPNKIRCQRFVREMFLAHPRHDMCQLCGGH